MKARTAVVAILCALAAPVMAYANEGVLVLAPRGTPAWDTAVKALVEKVDAQKAADVVFGVPGPSMISTAVDRLAKRGVTSVTAVPFFLTAAIPAEHLTGHAIPVRVASAAPADAIVAEIALSRAEATGHQLGQAVLVLPGYASEDSGTPWRLDLSSTAQRLNRLRRFAAILTIANPDEANAREKQQVRLTLERHSAMGRRILVVPVLPRPSEADPAFEQLLEGFSYEMASGAIVSDDRMAQWIVAAR